MTNYLINFADSRFQDTQQLGNMFAQLHGLDLTYSYTADRFAEEFKEYIENHRDIFECKRGYGFWLWKPFLISHILNKIQDGDNILYADSGLIFFRPPTPLFELLNQHDQLFFSLPGCLNRAWSKRDLFIELDCDQPKYWDQLQSAGQCSVWSAGNSSRQRAAEWLRWCENYQLISDHPSAAPNFPEFIDHRHDQSILSLLTIKWGVEIFRNPNQHGYEHPQNNSPYETLAFAVGVMSENTIFPEIWSKCLEPALINLVDRKS